MNNRIRNVLIGAALAAGTVSGAATIASAQTATTTPTVQTQPAPSSDSATAPAAPDASRVPNPDQAPPCNPDGKGPGPSREERSKELATALNLSVDQVNAAHQAARDAVDAQFGRPEKPATPPATDEARAAIEAQMKQRHDLFEKTFAEKLGVSADQLTAARVSIAKTHLDADVASGKITQDEANMRLQKIQNGEMPPPPGPRGPGGPAGPAGPGGPAGQNAPAAPGAGQSTPTTTK